MTRLLRLPVRVGICAALLGLGAVVVWRTVGWVFPVDSGSMEPVIHTGDWLAVRYGDEVPELYDCVVFKELVGPGASVKFVGGRPRDKVHIDAAGDLRVNGRLMPDAPGRPAPIPVFDSTLSSMEGAWVHGSELFDPWERVTDAGPGEEWRLDASAVGRGAELGIMRYVERIDDGHLRADGERVYGERTVHDVVVEFEARVDRAGGVLRVELTEQGDVFRAHVPIYGGGAAQKSYLGCGLVPGWSGPPPFDRRLPDWLEGGEIAVPIGRWFDVRFENVDNRLRLTLDGQILEYDYDRLRNTAHWNSPDGMPLSTGERVGIGGEGIEMRVRGVRVLRDLHVVPAGQFGVRGTVTLGDDEIYVLGFASGVSSDSRDRGPVKLDRLIGRASGVVWPLERRRDL